MPPSHHHHAHPPRSVPALARRSWLLRSVAQRFAVVLALTLVLWGVVRWAMVSVA